MVGLTCSNAGEFITVSDEYKARLFDQLNRCKTKLRGVLCSLSHLHEAKMSIDYNFSPEVALQKWLVDSIFAFRQ